MTDEPSPVPYSPERVAAAARSADPGLPPETAELLAAEAGRQIADGVADAPELARRLLAAFPEPGATAANVVAVAAVEALLPPGD